MNSPSESLRASPGAKEPAGLTYAGSAHRASKSDDGRVLFGVPQGSLQKY